MLSAMIASNWSELTGSNIYLTASRRGELFAIRGEHGDPDFNLKPLTFVWNEREVHGRGVALVPSIPLSRDRETRHFLILGSVGGETQTMLHLIIEAISRDDSVLVLDTKGDMMALP